MREGRGDQAGAQAAAPRHAEAHSRLGRPGAHCEIERVTGPCTCEIRELPGAIELLAESRVDRGQLGDVLSLEETAAGRPGERGERRSIGPRPGGDRVDDDVSALGGQDRIAKRRSRADVVTVGEEHENPRSGRHALQSPNGRDDGVIERGAGLHVRSERGKRVRDVRLRLAATGERERLVPERNKPCGDGALLLREELTRRLLCLA
jgi:hypothetical protein